MDGEGDYILNESTHYYTLFERDIQTSLYRLDEGALSHLTITEYNSKQNFIKGNFEMSLLLKQDSDMSNNEGKLIFKDGKFKVTLDELE